MRPGAVLGIAAAGAMMLGVFALFLTGGLLSELNPDPYEHTGEFAFAGTRGGDPVEGSAHLSTVLENGSFHNYLIAYRSDDGTVDGTFYVVFDPDDRPSLLEETGDGTYSGSYDGMDICITVGDHCLITGFTVECSAYAITGHPV